MAKTLASAKLSTSLKLNEFYIPAFTSLPLQVAATKYLRSDHREEGILTDDLRITVHGGGFAEARVKLLLTSRVQLMKELRQTGHWGLEGVSS